MSENKTASEHSQNALVHIIEKSPPWLRALVLIAVSLIVISIAGTFIAAVISGRSVEFWPPKVGQYESPSVQQCKAIIDFAKDLAQNNNKQIEQLAATMHTQLVALDKMRQTLVDKASSYSSGQYQAADSIKEEEKEIQDTTQKILDALKKTNDTFLSAQQRCVGQ